MFQVFWLIIIILESLPVYLRPLTWLDLMQTFHTELLVIIWTCIDETTRREYCSQSCSSMLYMTVFALDKWPGCFWTFVDGVFQWNYTAYFDLSWDSYVHVYVFHESCHSYAFHNLQCMNGKKDLVRATYYYILHK